ncbi:MAG: hypothetical protein NTY08_06235 [Proteobacteria bacterium]|nr:hypothetical protein [Pseudomonadota bacterium]
MRQFKQKLKRFNFAILAGFALSAAPSLAEMKTANATSETMTLAAASKKKPTKTGHSKRSVKEKSRLPKHQTTASKKHATWHAPHVRRTDSVKKTADWHPTKTQKKVRRSSHRAPKLKAKPKSVAAIPEPTPPAPEMTVPAVATPRPQQLNTATTKSLAAKSLVHRPKPAITDADTDSDRIVVDESNSPSYSLILLALLMAAGACYMYLTRRQQTLVSRRRQTDDKDKAKSSTDSDYLSSVPESAVDAAELSLDGDTVTPPPPASSLGAENTTQLPLVPHCTFELFVEIQVALSTWIDQGADTLANLQNHFTLSEADWLTESAYWGPKYLADDELLRKFNALSAEFRTKYRGSAA